MITFIDLGPKATVHLLLSVPVPLQGGGWHWGELAAYAGILAREFAYSADECRALVSAYGLTLGRLLQRRPPDRFQITARGPVTGRVLGLREWHWSAELRDFRPAGEYLCGWREAVKVMYQQTGHLFEGQRFRASAQPVICPERLSRAA